MGSISKYISETRQEFRNVTWPDRKTAMRLTLFVVIYSILFAAFLGILDYLFTSGITSLVL